MEEREEEKKWCERKKEKKKKRKKEGKGISFSIVQKEDDIVFVNGFNNVYCALDRATEAADQKPC